MVRIALSSRPVDASPDGFADPDPFLPLHREMDWPFYGTPEGSFDDPGVGPPSIVLSPHVAVVETAAVARIVAQLPGVRREDVDVGTEGRFLTIIGRRWTRQREDGTRRPSGRVSDPVRRSIRLPVGIDLEAAWADLAGGVPTITLPRNPPDDPPTEGGEPPLGCFCGDGGTAS